MYHEILKWTTKDVLIWKGSGTKVDLGGEVENLGWRQLPGVHPEVRRLQSAGERARERERERERVRERARENGGG